VHKLESSLTRCTHLAAQGLQLADLGLSRREEVPRASLRRQKWKPFGARGA